MEYSRCCRDCVLNNDCLLQKNNDVESCEDYRDQILEEVRKKKQTNPKNKKRV